METIIAKKDTKLVAVPMQSEEIAALGLPCPSYSLPLGTRIGCLYLGYHEGQDIVTGAKDGDDYYIVHLAKPIGGMPRLIWYAYAKHWEEEHADVHDDPQSIETFVGVREAAALAGKIEDPRSMVTSEELVEDLGPTIVVPGRNRPVHLREPVCYLDTDGSIPVNFNWSEVTNKGRRIPESHKITQNIEKIARILSLIRTEFDQPIIVTSWYRPPAVNKRVGGASQSRHLSGDGVDFYPKHDGITAETWKKLCLLYQGGGLASGRGFFHIDARPKRASWQYRGAPAFARVRHY